MSAPGKITDCIVCSSPLPLQSLGLGRPKLYCSKPCAKKARRERNLFVRVPKWAVARREPPPPHVREALRWLLDFFEGEGQ